MPKKETVTIRKWLLARNGRGYTYADKLLFYQGKRVVDVSPSRVPNEVTLKFEDGTIRGGVDVDSRFDLQTNPMLIEA
jgi:hypothetical protein